MSPIDDELRATLHQRAQVLAPAPDPLAGIEQRAKRMQRRRVGSAIAGSALAVAMIAVAVPAIQSATSSSSSDVPSFASPQATAVTQYALDPDNPWGYRGIPLEDFGENSLNVVTDEYATRRGVADPRVTLTPLFGQRYEPADRTELVFLADVDGELRWGVAASSEAGPEFIWDEPLPEPAPALAATLGGDEVPRLLVVAAPEVGDIEYAPDGATEFVSMTELDQGVRIQGLDGGDPATDSYRVLDPDGNEVVRADAPNPLRPSEGETDVPPRPDNFLDWPSHGQATPELQEQALESFAKAVGATREGVEGQLIFGGGDDSGREYVFMQAWKSGEDARTIGYITGGDQPDEPFLGPFLDKGPAVLAFLVPAGTGQSTDTLLVVPEPTTGEVLYAEDSDSELRPVESRADGVWLIDRDPRTTDDRLLILDGNGNFDEPNYEGPVAPLLCGAKSC